MKSSRKPFVALAALTLGMAALVFFFSCIDETKQQGNPGEILGQIEAGLTNPYPNHFEHRMGTFQNGTWQLDMNGDGKFDSNVDVQVNNFGMGGDLPVVGKFGLQLGIDSDCLGVYRPSTNQFYLDKNCNGIWEFGTDTTISVNTPVASWNNIYPTVAVAGEFSSANAGTELGFAIPQANGTMLWRVDLNHDGVFDDLVGTFGNYNDIPFVMPSKPVFTDPYGLGGNPDGLSRIATKRGYQIFVDHDRNFTWSGGDLTWNFGVQYGRPVALLKSSDIATPNGRIWNSAINGINYGISVFSNGTWYVDENQNFSYNGNDDYTLTFGTSTSIPVSGNWMSMHPSKFRAAGGYKEQSGVSRPPSTVFPNGVVAVGVYSEWTMVAKAVETSPGSGLLACQDPSSGICQNGYPDLPKGSYATGGDPRGFRLATGDLAFLRQGPRIDPAGNPIEDQRIGLQFWRTMSLNSGAVVGDWVAWKSLDPSDPLFPNGFGDTQVHSFRVDTTTDCNTDPNCCNTSSYCNTVQKRADNSCRVDLINGTNVCLIDSFGQPTSGNCSMIVFNNSAIADDTCVDFYFGRKMPCLTLPTNGSICCYPNGIWKLNRDGYEECFSGYPGGFDHPQPYVDPWSKDLYLTVNNKGTGTSGNFFLKLPYTSPTSPYSGSFSNINVPNGIAWATEISSNSKGIIAILSMEALPKIKIYNRITNTSTDLGNVTTAAFFQPSIKFPEALGSYGISRVSSTSATDYSFRVMYTEQEGAGNRANLAVDLVSILGNSPTTKRILTVKPTNPGGSILWANMIETDRVEMSENAPDRWNDALIYWVESSSVGADRKANPSSWGNGKVYGMMAHGTGFSTGPIALSDSFPLSAGETWAAMGDYLRGSYHFDPALQTSNFVANWVETKGANPQELVIDKLTINHY